MGLTKNVGVSLNSSEPLTYDQMVMLFWNTLDMKALKLDGINSYSYTDETVMEHYLKIYEGKGVVNANETAAIDGRGTTGIGVVRIDSEEYFKSIPTVMYYMDEPLADPSCIALYFVDKLAAEQIKVVLSGEGADEFFGGYNIYHEPISLKGYQKIPKCVRKGLAAVAKKMPDIKGRDFIIRGSKTVEERFIGNANMFSVEDREKLLKTKLTHKTPQDIVADAYKKVSHLNDIAKMQYIDTNFWLQGDILLKADKMSMAHCLESRVPFLDVKVFDYAKKLPIDFRCNDEATKRAFRIAAKRHIPEATANKKKLGFPVPIRVWLKEDNYYNKVMETLTGEAAQKFFNTDILVKLMEDHRAGKADNSRRIWTVYVFLVWYKVYFEDEDFRPINQDWIDNRVRTA